MELRGRRRTNKSLNEKKLEHDFVDEYMKGPVGKRSAKDAALKIRPELSERGAMNWGYRVLHDPQVRKRMHMIEQGGLMKIHDLLDAAIEVIGDFLRNTEVSDKIRLDAAKTILARIYGAIPESVQLVKFSIFDGRDKREDLREQIRKKLDEDIIDVEAEVSE